MREVRNVSDGSTAETARKRPERPWTAARTMAVSTAVLGQSHKDNVRCTAVDEQLGQLEAKEVQLARSFSGGFRGWAFTLSSPSHSVPVPNKSSRFRGRKATMKKKPVAAWELTCRRDLNNADSY